MSMMVNPYRFGASIPADDFSATCNIKLEFGSVEEESANFTTVIFNNPKRDTTTKKAGAASYLPDQTNTAAVKLSSNLDLGSGDFALTFWVYGTSEPATGYLAGRWATSGNRSWRCSYNATTNQFVLEVSTDGAATISANYDLDTDGALNVATFWNGTWREVVFKRVGTTISVVVESVAGAGTATASGALFTGGTNSTYIGASGVTNANPSTPFLGRIDEVLMTVAGTTKVDFSFDNPFATAVGGTTSSTGSVAANSVGTERYDTNGIRGITSITFPYVPYVSDFDLAAGDFTVEVFGIRTVGAAFSSHTSGAGIVGCWSGTSGELCWQFYIDGSGNFSFRYSTNGTSAAASISLGVIGSADTDYNLAAVRAGGALYLYVNGTRVVSTSISGTINNPGTASVPLGILSGMTAAFSNSGALNTTARLKGCRITKGTARYQNASYSVPSLPLP